MPVCSMISSIHALCDPCNNFSNIEIYSGGSLSPVAFKKETKKLHNQENKAAFLNTCPMLEVASFSPQEHPPTSEARTHSSKYIHIDISFLLDWFRTASLWLISSTSLRDQVLVHNGEGEQGGRRRFCWRQRRWRRPCWRRRPSRG